CVMRWTSVARAPQQEPRGGIRLAPGEIGNRAMEMGAPQRAVEKRADGIRACVLLNVENRYREDFATDWYSAEIAIGTIRLIAEDPAVRAIAVVAFSLPQQEELYQQEFEATVDFPRLTAAYERLETGVVKLTQLGTERELEFLRQTVDANRSCLQGSDLMVVVSPWWRESYPLQDEVLRILQPRPQQTLGYVRPGSFMTRSRHERTFNSWRLVDGFRGAIDKAGGRIVNVVSPFGMVDDIQQLVTQAADLGKP
ncbi:MAG: hypothetical protein MUF01_05245, partial [Bryobacterales bacterium]|nr:hypothetical protein [Bryobacterales bacterium]